MYKRQEYIRCSGDPDSLDAVWLPQLGTAVVDGTAPHVVEPAYPAAVGRYVNLGQFYNVDRLKERRREIVACTNGYQAEYRKAYACLHACGDVYKRQGDRLAPPIRMRCHICGSTLWMATDLLFWR